MKIYFWRTGDQYGYLSNWSSHPIFDQTGQEFKTMEHYLMFHKAKLFGDFYAMKNILDAKTPKDAKAWGRKVRNFDESLWVSRRKAIAKDGLKLKFTQHTALKLPVAEYFEASPYDKIWGTGTAQHVSHFEGENLLGKILTELAVELNGEVDNG